MRIIICNSDISSRDICRECVDHIVARNHITTGIFTFRSTEQMFTALDLQPTDILLIKADMDDTRHINGMAAAREMRQSGYEGEIVFLSESDHSWPEAFELEAIHYLVNGRYDEALLERTILRASRKIAKKEDQMMWLTCGYESRYVPMSEIHCFEVQNRIITVYYGQNNSFDFYSKIGALEQELLPKGFVRVHRSFLVAINRIAVVGKKQVVLRNGQQVPLGDKYKAALKDRLAAESTVAYV